MPMKQTITSLIFIAFLMIGKLVMASEIHIDIITEGTGDLAELAKRSAFITKAS